MTSEEDPTTRELRIRQAEREDDERREAAGADTDEGSAAATRRAEKAAYLREKLDERARSEREQG